MALARTHTAGTPARHTRASRSRAPPAPLRRRGPGPAVVLAQAQAAGAKGGDSKRGSAGKPPAAAMHADAPLEVHRLDGGCEPSGQCVAAERMAELSNYRALVLDVSFRPIDVINWQRALCMELFGKVDVLEYYDECVRTPTDVFPLPAVVKVHYYLKADKCAGARVSLNRRNILIRDEHTCQYCGKGDDLTIDHLWPQSKGGPWAWDNLVTACASCNSKKGAKTPSEVGLKLRRPPAEPPRSQLARYSRNGISQNPPEEWRVYLSYYDKADKRRSGSR